MDITEEGKVGAALLLMNDWQILQTGVHGKGYVAWATINMNGETVGFASIHGPTDKTARARLWKWMANNWRPHPWILTGDKSPVMKGKEERRWVNLRAHLDLIDSWECASWNSGPRFTRQQKRGNRLEQARLDRIYYTNFPQWAEKYSQVNHDASVLLSDHHPVLLEFKKRDSSAVRKSTYLKVAPEWFRKQETKEQIRTTWREAANDEIDARVRWERKWYAVRELLKSVDRKEKIQRKKQEGKLHQLYKARMEAASKGEDSHGDKIATLEKQIREIESKNEERWRRNARLKWLKAGDLPSKYFFSQMKENRVRQEIACLVSDQGEVLVDDQKILAEIHKFYTALFKQDQVSQEDEKLRVEVLQLLRPKITEQQNVKLVREPSNKEISEIIDSLKKETAPGLDGMTTEAMQEISVPIHLLAGIPIAAKTADELEGVCRDFLWGVNQDGKKKKPLVAWKELQKPKTAGGYDIGSFADLSAALKLKNLLKIFQSTPDCWMTALELLGWVSEQDAIAKLKELKAQKIANMGQWADGHTSVALQRPLNRIQTLILDEAETIFVSSAGLESASWYWQCGTRIKIGWNLSTKSCKLLHSACDKGMQKLEIALVMEAQFQKFDPDCKTGRRLADGIAAIRTIQDRLKTEPIPSGSEQQLLSPDIDSADVQEPERSEESPSDVSSKRDERDDEIDSGSSSSDEASQDRSE
ncbi:hypothetical protein R1sor_014343 [Riccia sorocarpa]|uniref:Uncharacterized protein n=1 Tax=Riccia sorocarpa TaxID=122646 RepID=A0ABD3HBZ5_9MARC